MRGQPGLEGAYRQVAAALKALMESALARQQQLEVGGSSFEEDRSAIVEQRAVVQRLQAQLSRKKRSTENLLTALAGK